MSMAGAKVVVKILDGTTEKVIAGQKGATLNRSAEPIETTSKSSGGYKTFITGYKDWSVDCDGIYVADDAALAKLKAAFVDGEAVTVVIHNEATNEKEQGQVLITDFPMEAPFDDALTYSMTLQGSGPLVSSKAQA